MPWRNNNAPPAEDQVKGSRTRMKAHSPSPGLARRAALLGILAALAVALSFLEGLLPPLPVPGAKLGLSNIVTMYALSVLGLPAALAVAVVKAAFALLRGGTAFLMSLAGGVLSTLVMALALRLFKRSGSFIAVGICGAIAHNGAQLGVAMLLLGPSLLYYGPFLLLAALAAGMLTGFTLNIVMPALRRIPRN